MTTKPSDFEARGKHFSQPAEIREAEDGTITVEGYAAVFDQETDIGGYWREKIDRNAFDAALDRPDDVVFLINHGGLPLARTRSGTLELSVDDHGLKMRAVLDTSDPDVARIAGKMRRGDLDKMSFAFWAERQEWDESGDVPVRTILEARLHDVAIVTTPAYDGTEIGLRSLANDRKTTRQKNFAARARRTRTAMNLAQTRA